MTSTLRLLLVFCFFISAPLFRGFSFYHSPQLSFNSDSRVPVIFCELGNSKKFERLTPDHLVLFHVGSNHLVVGLVTESPIYLGPEKISSKFDLTALARAPPSILPT